MYQKYSGRVTVILTMLALALLVIFSPVVANPRLLFDSRVPFFQKTNLKPGIDIVGGTSLLYQIKRPDTGTGDSKLAEHVMQALKKRVDPNGTLNLVWRPQGADRLEIQMPLSANAGAGAKARQTLEDARAKLESTNLIVADAVDALQGQNGKSRADFDKLRAASPPVRKRVLTDMAAAYDTMTAARSARDVAAAAEAGQKFDALQQQLSQTNLTPGDVDRVLSLRGSKTERLAKLRQDWASYPERLAAIDGYVKATEALSQGGGLESAADLKRLLQGSGVLEFHILPSSSDPDLQASGGEAAWRQRLQQKGPRFDGGDKFRWFEVENEKEFHGRTELYNDRHYLLASVKPEDSLDQNTGKWALTRSSPEHDQTGQSVVGFEFDSAGANWFGNLTSAHQHQPMAIMLDGRVISAPNINSPITGGRGIITGGGEGGFSGTELDYLVRMLSAGSLPAQLDQEPISERTVGPQLGEDNLRAGLLSCGLGLLVICIFLVGYYHLSGVIAFGAVVMNIILILGCMAAINATFTLPGIAAIVLTIGTAVDANVLVFERLREEQHRGLPIRMAVRNAYDRAFSAIVDSNMTTVITSFFLVVFGTEEVKGFGIVLIIGILASMFTALFVTRTVFGILIDRGHVKRLGSLPLSYPKWEKILHPHIDWMRLAIGFYAFSLVAVVAGLGLFIHYANKGQVLDIEFASGTAITFELKQPAKQETVRQWLEIASKEHPDVLPNPGVVRVGEGDTTWELTTPNADSASVRKLVVGALGEGVGGQKVLKAEQPSKFQGVGKKVEEVIEPAAGVVLPLTAENLAPAAAGKWPGNVIPEDARRHVGGAAILLTNLDPPLTPTQIKDRLDRQTLQVQTGQQSAAIHDFEVFAPGGADKPATSAVVLTSDETAPYDKDQARWTDTVVAPMWSLVNDAVSHPPDLQQVKTFNASVAGDTQRDALIALSLSVLVIMAYIWIRFGNLKYGAATVVALLHDVVFTVAALGFAHLLANTFIGDALQLEPFRINLTVVAGILTIMGYSMVDTIVVFDRIREIRGKYGHVSRQVVNDAVNQTLSRTLLTAGSTLVMVAIMYFLGGSGIHGFTFVLLIGILVGSYSSIAIASPILLLGRQPQPETSGKSRAVGRLQQAGT